MATSGPPPFRIAARPIWQRQLLVSAACALVLASVVITLWRHDRRREWRLRNEQTAHRLDVASALIVNSLDEARADALFLADQAVAAAFVSGDLTQRPALEREYRNFVRHKTTYDQIRLLNLSGEETIRVNYVAGKARAIPVGELQDKEDRSYFRRSRRLAAGDVFVSEFDLNQEHGVVERPLKPVIRVIARVGAASSEPGGLLVLNYLGARLLRELDTQSSPGHTLLVRADGQYLHAVESADNWGWLLGHDRTFASQFPAEWADAASGSERLVLTASGAFASRKVEIGMQHDPAGDGQSDTVIVVAYVPAHLVFADSTKLLRRLMLLAGCTLLPLAVLACYWAQASVSRQLQAGRIAASEERLRDLSSRLLRIQEDERRAISRQIHDELGQQATAVSLDLKLADRNLDAGAAKPHLARAIGENAELLRTLHEFATRVRPAVLDDLGLLDAVESHLWEFSKRTGIRVQTFLEFQSHAIPDVVADNVYRLLQESLNNVAKHAEARCVSVHMSVDASDSTPHFRMVVSDDGQGYGETERSGERLGLLGMQERVDLLGGQLVIQTNPGQGTRVEISLPLTTDVTKPTTELTA